MANKNFEVKHGLSVGGTERITSAGAGSFTDLTLSGDLNITGDVNSVSVTDLDVTDKTITLGKGQAESASGGSGIVIDGSSASMLWDETTDVFDFNKGISTTGNVGIGMSNPDKRLVVQGADAEIVISDTNDTPLLRFRESGTTKGTISTDSGAMIFNINGGSTEIMRLRNDSKVGIGGISSPYGRLTVTQASGADNDEGGIGIVDSSNGRSMRLYCSSTTSFINSGNGGGQNLVLNEGAGSVGIGTDSPVERLDVVGKIRATQNIVSNTAYQMLAFGSNRTINDYGGLNKDYWRVNLMTPGTNTTGESNAHAYGSLVFSGVTGTNTTYVNRLVLEAGGNVGIGIDNPSTLLHIKDTNPVFTIESSSTSGSGKIRFADPDDNDIGRIEYGHNSNAMVLGCGDLDAVRITGTSTVRQLRIRTSTDSNTNAVALASHDPSSGNLRDISIEGEELNLSTGSSGGGTATSRIRIFADGQTHISNNNDGYNLKVLAGDADSWFGVFDDANNSANVIITRSNTTESFKHAGHTGLTTINATGVGLNINSTNSSALSVTGNAGGLNFVTGINQRIYFNGYRALEGNNNGTNLQIGEGYSTLNLQGALVAHGHLTPSANNSYDLGSSSHVWRDLYIGDIKLSNEGHEKGNDVDGTKGNWTIQEGEEHLFIINNNNGKKYKFALEEIE